MFTENTVTVVAAATGHQRLPVCLKSVQDQTFPAVEHWVVIDGVEHEQKVRAILDEYPAYAKLRRILTLPGLTGKDKWCGHRIHAAMSFLVGTEFISFLDEDNWYDPDHVGSLVAAVRATPGGKWAFALRKIVDEEGKFLTLDNCECLGNLHPVFFNPEDFHIDTNCYLLHRLVAVQFAPAWYRPGRVPAGTPLFAQLVPGTGLRLEADNALCRLLLNFSPPAASNRKHTLNYLVGNRSDSVRADFFHEGNKFMRQKFPAGLPWEAAQK